MKAYVLNQRGNPLMPCSPAKARKLLKLNKACIVRYSPFIIQLTAATGEAKQDIDLGVDAGYRYIGLSASTRKEEVFASEVELRQNISSLLSTRAVYRQSRRYRKTRYRACKLNKRTKKKGWLPPSTEHKINSHISRIEDVMSFLPITSIIIELATFDIQKINNPDIEGDAYQIGKQAGFWNVREYVLFRDSNTCQYCHGKSKDPILQVHHIESRKSGGNAPNNLITLCKTCHAAYHRGEIKSIKLKRGKSFKAESFMSTMSSFIIERLKAKYPNMPIASTYGYLTKYKRILAGLSKSHCTDAFCIASNLNAKRSADCLYQKQVRRHNRKIHKYKFQKTKEGSIRRLNQAPYTTNGFRLFDKVLYNGKVGFVFARMTQNKSLNIRQLDGTVTAQGVVARKVKLIEKKRRSFICEVRKIK